MLSINKKHVYKRVDNSPPTLLETITVEAKMRGNKMKMVTIAVYDTLQDSYQLNDCVGLPQLYRIIREHGYITRYVKTDNGMRMRLVKGK
jgi:hypothetical protein